MAIPRKHGHTSVSLCLLWYKHSQTKAMPISISMSRSRDVAYGYDGNFCLHGDAWHQTQRDNTFGRQVYCIQLSYILAAATCIGTRVLIRDITRFHPALSIPKLRASLLKIQNSSSLSSRVEPCMCLSSVYYRLSHPAIHHKNSSSVISMYSEIGFLA